MGAVKRLIVICYFGLTKLRAGLWRISSKGLALHPYGEFISDEIRRTKTHYEYQLLVKVANLIRPATFIDIGANIGNHSNFFQQLGSIGIAFEPNPSNWKLLRANASEFVCHQVALGSQAGCALMAEYQNSMGNGHMDGALTLGEPPTSQIEVEVATLDSFDLNLRKPALVKIDVEGSELEVLRGGVEFFSRHLPALWLELHEDSTLVSGGFPYSRVEIKSLLASFGYDLILPLNETNFLFSSSRDVPSMAILRRSTPIS